MVNFTKEQKMELFTNKVGNPYSTTQIVKEPNWRKLPLFGSDVRKTYKDKLNKFGLLELYPHLIDVIENQSKPNFRDVLRSAGKRVTSFGNTRTTLKRLGVIDYNGSVMVKGTNWNRFVGGKWDWFELSENHKVFIIK
jgi:hypothetical protein